MAEALVFFLISETVNHHHLHHSISTFLSLSWLPTKEKSVISLIMLSIRYRNLKEGENELLKGQHHSGTRKKNLATQSQSNEAGVHEHLLVALILLVFFCLKRIATQHSKEAFSLPSFQLSRGVCCHKGVKSII